jgi:hypothetical protein
VKDGGSSVRKSAREAREPSLVETYRGVLRQEIAYWHDIVTEFAEQVAEILGDALVEQEPYR